MRSLVIAALLFAGCGGDGKLGESCAQTCDCKETHAPLRCPGEWVCNEQKRCEYICKPTCADGAPSTCRDDDVCNGAICSSRTRC